MSEPVREYCTEQLGGRHERFVDWAIDETERTTSGLRACDAEALLAAFDDEYPNLRMALTMAVGANDSMRAYRLCGALTGCWDARSMLRDARHWIDATLALPEPEPIAATVLSTWLGYFCAMQADYAAAQRHATKALDAWNTLGIDAGTGYARLILGRVAAETGRPDAHASSSNTR